MNENENGRKDIYLFFSVVDAIILNCRSELCSILFYGYLHTDTY